MPRKKQNDPMAEEVASLAEGEQTDEPKKKRFPKVDVLTRRLADPLGSATAIIRLKTPVPTDVEGDTWHTRWIDSSQQGRVFDILEHKGWEQVRVSELTDKRDVAGLAESPDGGYVTRGDKGRELLVKMPTSWWNRIHNAKVELWSGRGKTKQQRKAGIAQQVSDAVKQARAQGAKTIIGDDEAGEMTMALKGTLPGGAGVRLEKGPMLAEDETFI